MITNYKINQPFTSDCSVEEGEKNSSRTWNHGEGRIVNHVETFFYAEARKVSGRKTIQSQHCESQFVPGWTEFFSGSLQRKPFSIIRDKYSSRQTRHVLKPETPKRNRRNETTGTTGTTETTGTAGTAGTKPPKPPEQPKRNHRNNRNKITGTTETKTPEQPKRNHRKYV